MNAPRQHEPVRGRGAFSFGLVLAGLSAGALALVAVAGDQAGTQAKKTSEGGVKSSSEEHREAAGRRSARTARWPCWRAVASGAWRTSCEQIPGVLETEAGYTGGWLENPRYDDTHDSKSGHAESVRIVFDPRKLSYEDLLEKWFFRMHDPTTLNRQGNDVGTQYRSAIFYADDAQRAAAEAVKARVQASGKWKRPIVTEIVKATTWYPAEDYHQDYLQKNPGGYTCHFMRD